MSMEMEIKNHLVTQGISASIIGIGPKVDIPDRGSFIVLRATPGLPAYRTHEDGALPSFENPYIQVSTHTETRAEGDTLIRSVCTKMCVRNTVLGQTRYLYIEPIQPPFPFGLDERKRVIMMFNARVAKQPS